MQGRFQAAWMQFTKCIDLDEGKNVSYVDSFVIRRCARIEKSERWELRNKDEWDDRDHREETTASL